MAKTTSMRAPRPPRRKPSGAARPLLAQLRRFPALPQASTALLLVALVSMAALSVASLVATVGLAVTAGRRVVDDALQTLTIPAPAERSTIYAADGSVLGTVYKNFDRQAVPLGRIPAVTRDAVLAVEDAGFYQHGAIDVRSIVRAVVADVSAGSAVQGGSTITQQLVKDTITGNADTLGRKVREALDALRVESTYTKDQVLDMYLNEVYLGHGAYGVEAGAEFYFGKHVEKLSAAESAMLAGVIAAPDGFDPLAHPRAAKARREFVLTRMLNLGWIQPETAQRAAASSLGLSSRLRDVATPGPTSFLMQYVVGQFLADPAFGTTVRQRARELFQGGLRIFTTLDPALQRDAVLAIRNRMTGAGLPQSALVSIVPKTGAVRAMALGNWPWAKHRYNLATDPGGGRTAGSAFKAFTLAAALESGISPSAVYDGHSPRTIPNCGGGETWTVHNAEPGSGRYPLWLATADSVNAVFAQVINQVGPDRVVRVAHRMGITSSLVPVCPLTLGTSPVSPLDMTSGYATIANGGVHCVPYVVSLVLTRSGDVLQRTKPQCDRAMPPDVAAEETAMLENVIRFGTGTAANIGRPEAGKTGTGENYVDAWFVGFVPQLATGVWVGYATAETPMPAVPGYGAGFGGVLAAPIWHDFMLAATRGMLPLDFPPAPTPLGGSLRPSRSTSPSPTPTGSPSKSPSPPGGGNGNGNGHG